MDVLILFGYLHWPLNRDIQRPICFYEKDIIWISLERHKASAPKF